MLTEEDFEKAEEALRVIDVWGNQDRDLRLIEAEMVVYAFARKILAQARRDFLTEPNDLEARVKSLENKFEQVKVVFTTRGTQTIPKITPMK